MIVTCAQMLEGERAAFARGVSAADLMEEAARGIFEAIRQFQPQAGTVVLYLGKGNNAGDALVVGRLLLEAGWKVVARPVGDVSEFKELPAKHWQILAGRVPVATESSALRHEPGSLLLVDGILGIGASPSPLSGAYAAAVEEMNALRRSRHAFTVAVDLPSGLGAADGPCVQADLTVTVAHAKDILLADHAANGVGRLAVAPLEELNDMVGGGGGRILTPQELLPVLPCRSFDFHKGQAGRVGVIAGSRGYVGAAILTATGALRAGAGLITLYVKEEAYTIFAAQAPVEVMVKPVADYREVLENRHDALAIGPGLGRAAQDRLLEIIQQSETPMVLDADALNMLADGHLAVLRNLKSHALLTPHPGEMQRLIAGGGRPSRGDAGASRREQAEKMAAAFPKTTWLLKGSRTVIATQGRPTSFNTTGHPGMATGGTGDVLTGICAALIGQGVELHDAASLGAWLSGRAAESALLDGQSAESLTPGDLLAHLGRAFGDLRRLVY